MSSRGNLADMGNSLSPAQKQHVKELQFLLKWSHHQVGEAHLVHLILEIDSTCSWYPEGGMLKPKDGEDLLSASC